MSSLWSDEKNPDLTVFDAILADVSSGKEIAPLLWKDQREKEGRMDKRREKWCVVVNSTIRKSIRRISSISIFNSLAITIFNTTLPYEMSIV